MAYIKQWTINGTTYDIKALADGDGNIITSKYVTLDTAQTITGAKTITNNRLQVNHVIFSYAYGGLGNNYPAFVWDKPGSYYTGMGANGTTNRIYFGPVNSDGTWNWVDNKSLQSWEFGGQVIADNGFVGSLSGNASSATALQTARSIWGQSFNGTNNITGNMSNLGTQMNLSSGIDRFMFLTSSNGAAWGSFKGLYLSDSYDNNTTYRLDVQGTLRATGYIYSNQWIQFDNWTGIYSPNNGAHFFPNNATSYGAWTMAGSKNGYCGLQLNNSTGYMTLMDSGTHKGLFQEGQRWILYYNYDNQCIGLGESGTDSSYRVMTNGSHRVSGTLKVNGDINVDGTTYVMHNRTGINFRQGSSPGSWDTWCAHETAGNEALVFGSVNSATSFIFVNGESASNIASDRWTSLTATGLRICQNTVGIRTATTTYALNVGGDIRAEGAWLRTTGQTGWYSDSYGGGIWMSDSIYVRVYNGKAFLVDNGIYAKHGHDFIVAGNEFNFIPDSYNSTVWFNYESWSRNSSSIISEYLFGNGRHGYAGGRMSYLYGAVWNDYAEYRAGETTEPGRCVREDISGELKLTTKRLEKGCEIISDTFGFAIGETETEKTPIAAAGRVLAYTDKPRETFELGMPVCSGPNGTVSQMTPWEARMYPWCIIGTVSEIPTYERWGTGDVEVNGRIWIRIR